MADVIDVQNALAAQAVGVLYPNGTGQASIAGVTISIFPGWPNAMALDAAISSGNVFVTVFPKEVERNTTRYLQTQQVVVPAAPTITVAIAGQVITLSGTIATPQNVGLLINGAPYVYAVQATDTLTSIATALAVLVSANVSGTTSSGPLITIGSTGRIQAARVGACATVAAELKRQDRVFCMTVWAPSPQLRDGVASAIEGVLAGINFLTMPDGFAARLLYRSGASPDNLEKQTIYRRDLNYSVEFATTSSASAAQVLFTQTEVSTPTVPTVTTYN